MQLIRNKSHKDGFMRFFEVSLAGHDTVFLISWHVGWVVNSSKRSSNNFIIWQTHWDFPLGKEFFSLFSFKICLFSVVGVSNDVDQRGSIVVIEGHIIMLNNNLTKSGSIQQQQQPTQNPGENYLV
eukprot:TRINITY_DN516_c0_g1_i2.p1 TRINITY_DN516_c0_g1~~TRINITY_DN516_c0_g1_i2.p1  ORF type:complete len:126 (-),score=3.86 TRINITY_DN516_c0_g1_i2:257-634(-)